MHRICWKAEWAPLAKRHRDRTAVVDAEGATTYADLFAAAAGVAETLRRADLSPGEAVATLVPNSRHAVVASYGIILAGVTEAPINPVLSVEDVAHCLKVAKARRYLTTRDAAAKFASLDAEPLFVDEMPRGAMGDLPAVHAEPGAWARILFTSGTTGSPKGIAHSHEGRWIANTLLRATLPIAPQPGREVLLVTPYSHGAGLMTQAFLDGGATVRLLQGVDVAVVAELLAAGKVEQMFAPPTVLAKIVRDLAGQQFDGVEAIFCGTAPLRSELYRQAKTMFGPVIRVTYGKTEVFNPITVLTPEETDRWYADPRVDESVCVGWPASGVEVAIGADEDEDEGEGEGEAAAPAQDVPRIGPVLLRAQHMLVATLTDRGVEPHEPNAFHRTGDLGYFDEEGRLHMTGREADVIKSGGYRITPEEIEAKLAPALPGGEMVVFGMPSAYWGETITLAVAGAPPEWREALAPALEQLTAYKRPRLFAEVPEIARNGLGKVMRRRAREAVLERFEVIDGPYPRLERR